MTEPLEELAKHGQDLDAIWSGYKPSERSYGVFREGQDVLLLHRGHGPEGFEPLADWRKIEALDGIAWYREKPLPELNKGFYINHDVKGVKASLIRNPTDREGLDTLIHEDFHGYQEDQFQGDRVSTLQYLDFGDSALNELITSMVIEGGILQEALKAKGQERRGHVLNYLGLRQHRESQMPPSFIEAERSIETHEGTATWVSMKAMQHLPHEGTPGMTEQVNKRLDDMVRAMRNVPVETFARARLYGTGAGLAELLEMEHPGQWQSLIQDKGWSLHDTLVQLMVPEKEIAEFQARGKRLRKSALFSSVLANVERLNLTFDSDASRKELLAGRRWEVEIQLPGRLNADGEETIEFHFSGGRAIALPDGSLLVGNVKDAHPATDLAKMRIEGHPVLKGKPVRDSDMSGGADYYLPITVFTHILPRGPEGQLMAGSYRIHADEFELKGVAIESDQPIIIKIRERTNSQSADSH